MPIATRSTDHSAPASFASFAQAAMEAQRRANLDPCARTHYVGIFPGGEYRVDHDLGVLVARGAVGIETFRAESAVPAAGVPLSSIRCRRNIGSRSRSAI